MNDITVIFVDMPIKPTFVIITLIYFFSFQVLGWSQDKSGLSYNLEKPSHVYKLPSMLEEISGLSYYEPNVLATINDEQGVVFLYDLKTKKIIKKIKFEKNGDYEGIERVGDHLYVVKSNGNLYKFHIDVEGEVEEISSPFGSKNNIEGLGYNEKTNSLLLALKGNAEIDKNKIDGKAVYAYDLTSGKFSKKPMLVLKDKDLERVLGANSSKFRPSGIAVHPLSGEIYMLASVGSALVVFNADGSPKNLSILKRSIFPQPEGIAFSPQGDLYISNENQDGGTILHFMMK